MVTVQNYTDGQITIYGEICFESWVLVPGQLLWSKPFLGVLYVCIILFFFLGIAIAADTFMLSIEMITSKKRIIYTYDREKNERVPREVFVWNETIANLTLMALGSSAPEILISVFETLESLSDTEPSESLGLFTIIGSAAYNLIVITAICVIAVPTGTSKKVNEFGVFLVTSFWSIFAYLWLVFVVRWSSANEIELWEAILTLLFFPLLVISAWMQDKGCWLHKCKGRKMNKHITELHRIESSNTENEIRFDNNEEEERQGSCVVHPNRKLSEIRYNNSSALNNLTSKKAFARARFRHAVVLSITGKTKSAEHLENTLKQELKQQQQSEEHHNGFIKTLVECEETNAIGTFCFSSASYSVSRASKYLKINVLLNRHKKKNEKVIGFSHIVDVARKKSWLNIREAIQNHTIDDNQNHDIVNNPSVNGHNGVKISTHTPIMLGMRKSLPDVEQDETTKVSFSPNNNLGIQNKAYDNGSFNQSFDLEGLNGTTNEKTSNSTSIRRSTEWDMRDLKNASLISYETREGNAKHNKDFIACSGTLVFNETEYCKTIQVQLPDGNLLDCEKGDDEGGCDVDFYIVLKDPCHDSVLGDPSIAHVSIIKDNEPGEFIFQDATAFVNYKLYNASIVTVTVVRIHGSDGSASVFFRTINGTAIGGDDEDLKLRKCDFVRVDEGVLNFSSGETSKKIMIKANPHADKNRTFIIALYHASGSAKIGHRSATIVSLASEMDEIVNQVSTLAEDNDKPLTNAQEYRKQFTEAMSLDEDASLADMFLHVLCFVWKIMFAFIPPRTMWGGWATFGVSLLMLGLLAALVEQYAKLLGCIIGLHVSVTGITLVALGTSMPDTFASKTAALQDESADAAIGNITGSNSVNVFLGLGLPWVIKAIYLATQGATIKLSGDELMFSVLVFLACGLITLSMLVLRRVLDGGELGGSSISKYSTGGCMIMLWLIFVTCTALQAYGIIHVDGL